MAEISDIQPDLSELMEKEAWGLSRIHGSMFFLQIGEKRASSYQRRDGTVRHFDRGKWELMFGMTQWRFEKSGKIIVACEDDQKDIDKIFAEMTLGSIKAVSISPSGLDLAIYFDVEISLKTFSNSALQEWDQWTLYCPHDRYWAADGKNGLITGVSSEPRKSFSQ